MHSRLGRFPIATVALVLFSGCHVVQQSSMNPPPPSRIPGPPSVSIPNPTQDLDLDQLRADWATFPTTAGWTRARTADAGPSKINVAITGYRGISNIGQTTPPASPVLFAHMVNYGNGIERRYRLKNYKVAEYYVIVDGFDFGSGARESRWRILEVPSVGAGKVDFVRKGGNVLSGKVTACPGHLPKTSEEADFWNCSDGDIQHSFLFSAASSLASAASTPLEGGFLEKIFKAGRLSARPASGDESAWASCSGGCCTLEEF